MLAFLRSLGVASVCKAALPAGRWGGCYYAPHL